WIEETLFYFWSHAGACVADREDYTVAVFLTGDANFAAARHCINRVVDHVDQYFAEFNRITFDEGFAVSMKRKANGRELRAGFPTRARHFACIFEEFGD